MLAQKISNDIFDKSLVLPSNLSIKEKDILYFKKIIDKV